MSKFKIGEYVWWYNGVISSDYVTQMVVEVMIVEIVSENTYKVKIGRGDYQTDFQNVTDFQIFKTKKDALNALIRNVQEALFNG